MRNNTDDPTAEPVPAELDPSAEPGPAELFRKSQMRGGDMRVLGAAAAFAVSSRARAAPPPPHARGMCVEQPDPLVNRVPDVKSRGSSGSTGAATATPSR